MPTFDDLYAKVTQVGRQTDGVQHFIASAVDDAWHRARLSAITDPDIRQLMLRPDLTPHEKIDRLKAMRSDAVTRSAENKTRIDELDAEAKAITHKLTAMREVKDWLGAPLILQRAEVSVLHQLAQAARNDSVINTQADRLANPDAFRKGFSLRKSFVIQHDWAKAFQSARDYGGADFQLPYQACAFEFRISGRRIIACVDQSDNRIGLVIFVQTTIGWLMMPPYFEWKDAAWSVMAGSEKFEQSDPFTAMICSQIMAISVALDAKVAEGEVVRVPTKLNKAREKGGKLPLFDYHIVSLVNRSRAPAAPPSERHHRSPRLHFRRGHWRHYEAYKTWIKWTLVGNPELGFIDKEYRL